MSIIIKSLPTSSLNDGVRIITALKEKHGRFMQQFLLQSIKIFSSIKFLLICSYENEFTSSILDITHFY